jgi:hypothetical protein
MGDEMRSFQEKNRAAKRELSSEVLRALNERAERLGLPKLSWSDVNAGIECFNVLLAEIASLERRIKQLEERLSA